MNACKYILFVLALSVNTIFYLNGTQLAITRPGYYQLGQNFVVSPTGSDTVITIASGDVTLDFNGHFISQANATSGITGVFINPNLTDITIQNGLIQNISGTGLVVSASDRRIDILNMTFTNCSSAAIAANGSAGTISNLEIRSCIMSGCCSNSTDRNVIFLSTCRRSRMIDCMLDNTVNSLTGAANQATQFAMISTSACVMCIFKNIWIQNNTFQGAGTSVSLAQPNAHMILEQGNTNCEFNSIIMRNNNFFSGVNCTLNGFRALTVCDSNRYSECQFIGNNVLNPLAIGFNSFFGIWTNSLFSDCFMTTCSSVGTAGSGSTGIQTSLGSSSNAVNNCVVAGNTAFNSFVGILSTDVNSLFKESIAAHNSSISAAGGTSGMSMSLNAAHSVLYENIAHNNSGTNNAGVSGIVINASRGYLLSRNIAYHNGTVAANQLLNVAAASKTQTTSDQVATIGTSWTNLAISQ